MALDTETNTSAQTVETQKMLMKILTERSNMLSVLKASGIVGADAQTFTFNDVNKFYNNHFQRSDWASKDVFADLVIVDARGRALADQNLVRNNVYLAAFGSREDLRSAAAARLQGIYDSIDASELDSRLNPGGRSAKTPWIESERKRAREQERTLNRSVEKDLLRPLCNDLSGDFAKMRKDPANASLSDKDILLKLAKEKAEKAFEAGQANAKFKGLSAAELADAVAEAVGARFEYHRSHKLGKQIQGSVDKEFAGEIEKHLTGKLPTASTPVLGSDILALLQKADGNGSVTAARQAILRQYPLNELRAQFPELAGAFNALETSLKQANLKIDNAGTTLTNAETALKNGRFTGLKEMLNTIVNSNEYKALDKSLPGIKAFTDEIDALSGEMQNPNADPAVVFGKLKVAVTKAQALLPMNEEFGEVDVTDPKAEALYRCITSITGTEGEGAVVGLSEKYLSDVAGLKEQRDAAKKDLATAQDNAAKDIAAAHTQFDDAMKATASELAAGGNVRLKAILDSRVDVKDANGNLVQATYTWYDTNEEALYATNAVTKGYETAMTAINADVEREIAAMNDPRISRVLAQAKAAEAQFKSGEMGAYFKGVNEEALAKYLEETKTEMIAGKSGQELKAAQKEYEAWAAKINQAAGYINFTYARGQVDNEGRVSMTGAEAMARAHYLDNQRGKKEELVRNAARVREYESLGSGRDQWRHEMGNKYGAEVLTTNYNKILSGGKSALEAFDVAASDVAGKSLLSWTEGMGRIQHNWQGMLHRNLTTKGLIEVGFFFIGQKIGASIFPSRVKTPGSGGFEP